MGKNNRNWRITKRKNKNRRVRRS